MNLSVHEQFKDIEKQKSKKEKIAKLNEYVNSTKALAIILDLTFNPKIKWLLPPGAPPYNPSDHLDFCFSISLNCSCTLKFIKTHLDFP